VRSRGLTIMVLMTALAAAACGSSPAASTAAPTAASSLVPTGASTAAPTAATGTSSGGGAASVPAEIRGFAFKPDTITITAGGTVTWTNGDNDPHTVTFDDSSVGSSGNLNKGATFSATFPSAGTFTYKCRIHPAMKGTVVVP